MSRNVTRRKCATCSSSFRPKRRDAKYCSASCRQRAHRARSRPGEPEREIEDARQLYWRLVAEYAMARGASQEKILIEQSQRVDGEGNVYMGCEDGGMGGMGPKARLVGKVTSSRPSWTGWGLEAAGPPYSPPPSDRVAISKPLLPRSTAAETARTASRSRGRTVGGI